MNRRDFLKLISLTTAAVAAAPLIEEPRRKLCFVPSSAPVGSRVEPPEFRVAYDDGWSADASDWKLEFVRHEVPRPGEFPRITFAAEYDGEALFSVDARQSYASF